MSYFGAAPTGNFISTASQRVTSSTNNYVDLDHAISALSDVIVLVNSVKQDITNLTFTSASRITLGGTLVSSDVVEIVYLGKSVATQTPGTGTVTLDMLSATGTKSSSTFLRGDNTFASAGLSNWSENSGNLLPSNASYGIYLGVNSATASNLLDDFEEGTYTYAITSANGGTVSNRGGYTKLAYTKIGRMVNVVGKIETSGLGDLAAQNGDIRLSLPFTIGNFDDFSEQFASPVMWYNSASMSSMNMLFWDGASNDSFCRLVNVSSTLVDSAIQGNAPGSSLEMKVSITYQTS